MPSSENFHNDLLPQLIADHRDEISSSDVHQVFHSLVHLFICINSIHEGNR